MNTRLARGARIVRGVGSHAAARHWWVASSFVCLVALGGCVSVRTTGAGSVEDLRAEEHYKAVYAEQMTRVQGDFQLFAQAGSNPGVCNKGGSKQGCYNADTKLIADFQAMEVALDAITVPPRFVDGDKLFREAIALDARGLGLRNQAIANNDTQAWTEHKVLLDEAQAAFQKAYQAFPQDNRPLPPP